jgi:transcriptional regulator with XRE-family HTH domain
MSLLSQRVRDYRYTKGWGPDELASRAAISRTALYQIESGKTELPRAGTLRRIAMALDVSMETLLGHSELPSPALTATTPVSHRTRSLTEYYPNEGSPLNAMAHRSSVKYDGKDTAVARFGLDYSPVADGALVSRERELMGKLHDLLTSPFGDAMARIIEETYRLLPQARVASYE